MTSYCFFPKKGNIRCRAAFNPKKGPAGTAKNTRFSRIFSDLGSRQSLLIYITQQDDRHRVAETLIARSCPSKLGRDTRS